MRIHQAHLGRCGVWLIKDFKALESRPLWGHRLHQLLWEAHFSSPAPRPLELPGLSALLASPKLRGLSTSICSSRLVTDSHLGLPLSFGHMGQWVHRRLGPADRALTEVRAEGQGGWPGLRIHCPSNCDHPWWLRGVGDPLLPLTQLFHSPPWLKQGTAPSLAPLAHLLF